MVMTDQVYTPYPIKGMKSGLASHPEALTEVACEIMSERVGDGGGGGGC